MWVAEPGILNGLGIHAGQVVGKRLVPDWETYSRESIRSQRMFRASSGHLGYVHPGSGILYLRADDDKERKVGRVQDRDWRFSHDGRHVAAAVAGLGEPLSLVVFDTQTGAIRTLGELRAPLRIEWTRDGVVVLDENKKGVPKLAYFPLEGASRTLVERKGIATFVTASAGSRVLFSRVEGKENQIYQLDTAGKKKARKLARVPGGMRNSEMAPDGDRAAFATLSGVYLVDADGARQLSKDDEIRTLWFSHDGSRLAFGSASRLTVLAGSETFTFESKDKLLQSARFVPGGDELVISAERQVIRWNPKSDRRDVLTKSAREDESIVAADLLGDKLVTWTRQPAPAKTPIETVDALVVWAQGKRDKEKRLASTAGTDGSSTVEYRVSPSGETLGWVDPKSGALHLRGVDGRDREIPGAAGEWAFSHNGRYVAVLVDRDGDAAPDPEHAEGRPLLVVDTESGESRTIGSPELADTPTWTRDGVVVRERGFRLVYFPLDGERRVVVDGKAHVRFAAGAGGSKLFFIQDDARRSNDLQQIDLAGDGKPRKLGRVPGVIRNFAAAPDGERIAFTTTDGVYQVDGDVIQRVSDDDAWEIWYSHDGSRLAALSSARLVVWVGKDTFELKAEEEDLLSAGFVLERGELLVVSRGRAVRWKPESDGRKVLASAKSGEELVAVYVLKNDLAAVTRRSSPPKRQADPPAAR